MAEDDTDLARELVELRDGDGVTLAKLQKCEEILACLQAQSGNPSLSLGEAMAAFRDNVTLMGDAPFALATASAYAIGVARLRNLTARRRKLAEEMKVQSLNTIKNWESRGLKELILRLKVLRGGDRSFINARIEQTATLVGRCTAETRTVRKIRSCLDGLREIAFVTRFERGCDLSTFHTLPLEGCDVVNVQILNDQARRVVFRLPVALARGAEHTLVYRTLRDKPAPAAPWMIKNESVKSMTEELKYGVEFDLEELPEIVWRINGLTHAEVPGLPEGNVIDPSEIGRYQVEFNAFRLGLSYGIGWRWRK